jgi:protein-disulfide isomerase
MKLFQSIVFCVLLSVALHVYAEENIAPLIVGTPNAPVTVLLFHDYSGPASSYWQFNFQKLKEQFIDTGILRVEIYAYPRFGKISKEMGYAVECSRLESESLGLKIHNILMAQPYAGEAETLEFIDDTIRMHGGDAYENIRGCIDTEWISDKFGYIANKATLYHINAMPSFVYQNGSRRTEITGGSATLEKHSTIINEILNGDSSTSFSDVPSNHENRDAIFWLAENGWIQGYEDGTFRPSQTINRAEFVKILSEIIKDSDLSHIQKNSLCSQPEYVQYVLTDVDMHSWYWPFVCFAIEREIVTGYPDKTFKPSYEINFAEAAKVIVEGLQIGQYDPRQNEPWYITYVRSLSYKKAIPMSIQSAEQFITRSEMAEIVYRAMQENNKQSRTVEFFFQNKPVIQPELTMNISLWGTFNQLERYFSEGKFNEDIVQSPPLKTEENTMQLFIENEEIILELQEYIENDHDPESEEIVLNINGVSKNIKHEEVYTVQLADNRKFYLTFLGIYDDDIYPTVDLFIYTPSYNMYFDVIFQQSAKQNKENITKDFLPISPLHLQVGEPTTDCGDIVKLPSSCIGTMAYYTEEGFMDDNAVIVSLEEYVELDSTAADQISSTFSNQNIEPLLIDGHSIYLQHSYFGSYYYWLHNNLTITILPQTICDQELLKAYHPTSNAEEHASAIAKSCNEAERIAKKYLDVYPSSL